MLCVRLLSAEETNYKNVESLSHISPRPRVSLATGTAKASANSFTTSTLITYMSAKASSAAAPSPGSSVASHHRSMNVKQEVFVHSMLGLNSLPPAKTIPGCAPATKGAWPANASPAMWAGFHACAKKIANYIPHRKKKMRVQSHSPCHSQWCQTRLCSNTT